MRRAATFALALLAACGSRTGLLVGDAAVAATPCVPGARPSAGTTSTMPYTPPPATAAVVVDDGAGHALWIGGLSSSGVYADRVGRVDTRSGAYEELALAGEAVTLPTAAGGVWDPRRSRAIVLGGVHGGADISQVFALTVSGGTATAQRLPDLPDAVVSYPVGAYDPLHDRIVVTGFLSSAPPDILLASRGTYALALAGTPGWSLLVPPDGGPPPALPGEFGWMAFDPASNHFVQLREGNRFAPGSLWTLDATAPTAWTSAGTVTLPADSYLLSGAVPDSGSCGLLALATDGHCGFDLVWLGIAADGSATVELRGDATQAFTRDAMAFGSVVWAPDRSGALVVRGATCDGSDRWIDAAVHVTLSR